MAEIVDQREARARVHRIRIGIHSYLSTLKDIADAYQARDWQTLGYADWQSYVDGEFSEERLRLPTEHRQKAVAELRMAGLSTRAIGAAVGIGKSTVQDDLTQLSGSGQLSEPERVTGLDGKSRPATSPPLVEAIRGEIDDTATRQAEPWETWSPEEFDLLDRLRRGEAVVVNQRSHGDLIRWADDADLFVRIDRQSVWGNPFVLPDDGDRDTVIKAYEENYLPNKPSLLSKLTGLRGKALGCWCAPEACHGDVLKAWAES